MRVLSVMSAWIAHLELPLRGHHLGVGPREFYAGVEAGPVVGFDDFTTDHFVGADAAIIRTLWAREAVLWPTERPAVEVQKSILLLDTEPRFLILDSLHRLVRAIPLVRLRWRLIAVVSVAEHELVVTATEGIVVDRHRVKEYITVATVGLVCRAAVISPRRQVWKR